MKVTFNLLGPQGSGKGTQAKVLLEHFDFALFEAGGALREIMMTGSEMGKLIASYIHEGDRVPDALMTEVMTDRLKDYPTEKDILFDGIMRSLGQVRLQEQTLNNLVIPQPVVLFFNLDEATAIDRLGKRRVCTRCGSTYTITDREMNNCPKCGGHVMTRHDDIPEAIKKRLALYHRDTLPVVEYFRSQGKVIDIDARPSIDVVSQEIITKIKDYYQSQGLIPPLKNE